MDFVGRGDRAKLLLVAVADGAGSASHSHLGSKTACTTAILNLKKNADGLADSGTIEDSIRQCFDAALREVEDLAQREGVAVREVATTLQVAVVGEDLSAFGQVGDGAIVWGQPGELRLVHWPDQAAINVTDFLTSAPLGETLRIVVERSSIQRIACMTDGLAPLLLDFRAKCPHAPVFERLFATCAAAPDPLELSDDLAKFLESPHVNDRTDDDKTLVLALRQNEGIT